MGGRTASLDPKLVAVLARLCERLGSINKTQAVKLPYLVDVIANYLSGKPITSASYEAWAYGVVAADVWFAFKGAHSVGVFSIEEEPYGEGAVRICLNSTPRSGELSGADQAVVDHVAEHYGALSASPLGELTKAMNPGIRNWGSSINPVAVPVDDDAYARLAGRMDTLLRRLQYYDTDDESHWQEVTEHTPEFFRKSLGV